MFILERPVRWPKPRQGNVAGLVGMQVALVLCRQYLKGGMHVGPSMGWYLKQEAAMSER